MISARAAKKRADEELRAQGSNFAASHASRNKEHGVWVVSYRDPEHPDEILIGGALVVTDQEEVHAIGSIPGALDHLIESLGHSPDAMATDVGSSGGEGLAMLVEGEPDEAAGPAASVPPLRPWTDVLDGELTKPYFRELMRFDSCERLTKTVYPSSEDLFAAFHRTPYEEVKVVILGQDPYHQPGQANGLAFSVQRSTPKLPPSLRNIHAAMERDGFTPPPHGDLTEWATQGVLLLNTALSVRASEPNSNTRQWREFTDAVITKLSDGPRPVVFVLWGKAAQSKRALINEDRHEVVTAPHPAARGRFQRDFRESGTFTEVNRRLEGFKAAPIDWAIT